MERGFFVSQPCNFLLSVFDRDGTTEKVISTLRKCAEEGVRLVVFPETCIPTYPYFAWLNPPVAIAEQHERLYEQAVEVPGPVTQAVGEAAKAAECVVVLGINEREGGSLYNTQLIFNADGSLVGKRRKIMPTYHERLIWGWGDGSGLRVFETRVGRIGALICWEHYMPLARYALIAQGEEIHCSHFPGVMGGNSMSKQIDAAIRHHAAESGAFVINATGWLTNQQKGLMSKDAALTEYLKGGICTGIVSPFGLYVAGPLPEGEGIAIGEIDLRYIVKQKRLLDAVGHYSRNDILRLLMDSSSRTPMESVNTPFCEHRPERARSSESRVDLEQMRHAHADPHEE